MVKIDFNKNVSRIYNVPYANENRQLINSEFEDHGISEMRSYMDDVIKRSKPNYPLGMMKLFKQRPNYMPGGKHYTNRASSAFSASSDDDGSVNYCGGSGETYSRSYTTSKQLHKGDYYSVYGCDNYCYYGRSYTRVGVTNNDSRDYYINKTHGDSYQNIIAGWNLICYEYVGGDYWYDDENNIQYGMPDPSYCLETNKWRI